MATSVKERTKSRKNAQQRPMQNDITTTQVRGALGRVTSNIAYTEYYSRQRQKHARIAQHGVGTDYECQILGYHIFSRN